MTSLRFACLYFDQAIKPEVPMIGTDLPQELVQRRFLRTLRSSASGIGSGKVTDGPYAGQRLDEAALRHALDSVPASQNGRWSLIGDHPNLETEASKFDTIYLQLLNQFPLPSASASFEDILAFNGEHRRELIEFRNSISEFAHKMQLAPSEPAIADLVRDQIQSKLDSIASALNKKIGTKIVDKLTMGISIPGAIDGILTMFGLSPGTSIPFGNSVAATLGKSPVSSARLAPDCHYLFEAEKAEIVGAG